MQYSVKAISYFACHKCYAPCSPQQISFKVKDCFTHSPRWRYIKSEDVRDFLFGIFVCELHF